MFTALLADDEINILNLLEKLIDWNALNIEVIGKCQSGSEAYQAIISRKPDIVIIDIKMPGLSGLDVVRQIQEEGIFPNFILISGHKQFGNPVRCRELSCKANQQAGINGQSGPDHPPH